MTDPERRLWSVLRNKLVAGLRFRRQQPIGPYVADFYCAAEKLVIELDGGRHGADRAMSYDAARTQWLSEQGYRVVRFANDDVRRDRQGVVDSIVRYLEHYGLPLPEARRASTLPQGEGV
jgi:Uncharacterized protein conserved in bacteria